MSKVKLIFGSTSDKIIDYQGTKIEVKPTLSIATQAFLITEYIKDYFNTENDLISGLANNFIQAEYNLQSYIFQLNTNIDMDDFDQEFYVDSSLREKVYETISNYWDFRERLSRSIKDIEEKNKLEHSVGWVLSSLSDKLSYFMDKMSLITPEELEKIRATAGELIEKMNESSVIGDLKVEDKPVKKVKVKAV